MKSNIKQQLGISFTEILCSLLLLSIGTSAISTILMKCQILGNQNEWRTKTLIMAFGIREAFRAQKNARVLQSHASSPEPCEALEKSLDLKSWVSVLEQSFPGSTVHIKGETLGNCKIFFIPKKLIMGKTRDETGSKEPKFGISILEPLEYALL